MACSAAATMPVCIVAHEHVEDRKRRSQVQAYGACRTRERPALREDEHMIGFISRRRVLALGYGLGALSFAGSPTFAQQRFFRIGTGGTGGTYYPVGGMIANAVSTDKINVSAVATNGSVANVNGIVGG